MTEIKIESTRENVLLKRKEIRYRIIYSGSGSPSRESVRDLIAKNTGSKKDLVIVDALKQEAGKRELIGYSKIYQNTESAMLYEPDYELIRNGLKQKAASE
ncbi:MAG: 30S ribosomal protein S24e [Candidatus Thermoplasmatota archaeon]|jgi:small subunit ribosomal protein S24e|nr:30S ribosomal protein S24e [Candidatus Thermoplasmatota archaeon]